MQLFPASFCAKNSSSFSLLQFLWQRRGLGGRRWHRFFFFQQRCWRLVGRRRGRDLSTSSSVVTWRRPRNTEVGISRKRVIVCRPYINCNIWQKLSSYTNFDVSFSFHMNNFYRYVRGSSLSCSLMKQFLNQVEVARSSNTKTLPPYSIVKFLLRFAIFLTESRNVDGVNESRWM